MADDFDFESIELPTVIARPIDPLEIFGSLRPRNLLVKSLWLEQGDALRSWHRNHRGKQDVAILLNTGAGKTLVGLLCAQSLVNELRGKILYLCSTRQLVEQTVAQATEYGIPVTYYLDRTFSNDLYNNGRAPCITTYHAIFNGLAQRFRRDPAEAYIFDDAHTAGDILRSCYTLELNLQAHALTVKSLFALFRQYFVNLNRVVRYDELAEGHGGKNFELIPPFVIRENLAELQRLLIAAKLTDDKKQMFGWAHLCEHLDLCSVFVAPGAVQFTPTFVPARLHYALSTSARRLYLSATLNVQDSFIRTFGRQPTVISSTTSGAGECERMILVPAQFKDEAKEHDDIATAQTLVGPYKTLIAVPTYARALLWQEIASVPPTDDVGTVIDEFKAASDSRKLTLVGRYDGVDLPDDACRVMVIDDLPTGIALIERFMFERLGIQKSLRSTIASRVVQCFGRISRGIRDHGVFFLTGEKLIEWIQNPTNERILPIFLRKQLAIGFSLSKDRERASAADLIDRCLDREESAKWVSWYSAKLEAQTLDDYPPDDPALIRSANAEVGFGELLWTRQYDAAARLLAEYIDDAFVLSQRTGAWYAMWLAYCYELLGDNRAADRFYQRAVGAAPNILPVRRVQPIAELRSISPQARSIDAAFNYVDQRAKMEKILATMRIALSPLSGGTPTEVEIALKQLGIYLGLNSSRPDDEGENGGPDVCWHIPDETIFCIEAKTDKVVGGCYSKKELGQIDDHSRWANIQFGSLDIQTVFVGPQLPACERTNPGDRFQGIQLSEFKTLAERLVAAMQDIAEQRSPLMFCADVERVFEERGLTFPQCINSLSRFDIRLAKAATVSRDVEGSKPSAFNRP